MFIRAISGLSLVAAAIGAVAFSAPATACTNISGQWDCVDHAGHDTTGVLDVVYTGSYTVSHWYMGTLHCDDARATLDLTIDGNGDAQMLVDDFDTRNSSNVDCANVVYSSDWVAYDDASDTVAGIDASRSPSATKDPVTGEFRTFELSYNGTQVCYDELPMTFQNDGLGGSFFDFDASISGWSGNCSIDGTVTHSAIQAY